MSFMDSVGRYFTIDLTTNLMSQNDLLIVLASSFFTHGFSQNETHDPFHLECFFVRVYLFQRE